MAEPLRPVTDDDAEPMSVGEALGATGDAFEEAARVIKAAQSMSAQISEISGRARGFVVTPLAAVVIVIGGLLVLAAAIAVMGWAYADRAGMERAIREEREDRIERERELDEEISKLQDRITAEADARSTSDKALASKMDEIGRDLGGLDSSLARIEGALGTSRGRTSP